MVENNSPIKNSERYFLFYNLCRVYYHTINTMGSCCSDHNLECTLSSYDLHENRASVFINGEDKTSLVLYKDREDYPEIFAKIVALKGKKVIINFNPPGFLQNYLSVVDVLPAIKDDEYSGVVRHIVWCPDTNFYELIFKQQKYLHVFWMRKELYQEHASWLEPGIECAIVFKPSTDKYCEVTSIDMVHCKEEKGYFSLV